MGCTIKVEPLPKKPVKQSTSHRHRRHPAHPHVSPTPTPTPGHNKPLQLQPTESPTPLIKIPPQAHLKLYQQPML